MAVTFVLGRAGTGKTRACVDAVLARLAQPDDGGRLILLVPEQASFQMERLLATRSPGGAYCRAAVLSFTRLAQRVFADVGQPLEPVSSAARGMALRCAAARMGRSLRFFGAATRTHGFYRQLGRLIEDLLAEQVTPEDLRLAARAIPEVHTKRKIAEITRLYVEYLEWLGPARVDPAARLAVLRARCAALPWLPQASIWVDGFAGFTGQELATLVALAQRARELTVTLLLDPAEPSLRRPDAPVDPLHLFQRTVRTYHRLGQLFAEAGVTCAPPVVLGGVPPRFAATPALAALEAGLATPIGVPVETDSAISAPPAGVSVVECSTPRDELRRAAHFIREKLIDAGGTLRFRDFAVIARDLEPLAPLVAEVFAEYDIPYFLDRRRPMQAHPLSRLVSALIEAARTDLSVSAMTRLLRTGLLPLSTRQAEELENLIVRHAIHGGETWRKPTWDVPTPEGLDEPRRRVANMLTPLLQLAQPSQTATGATWARTLYDLLAALGVPRRIETWIADSAGQAGWERAETHRLAWEALCGVLNDVHDVLGEMPLGVTELAAIIGGTLREQTFGLTPPTLDQVLVSGIERSRHPDVQYAWVCAFNEGIFPARPADDDLVTTAEREALQRSGLAAPATHRDEAFGERLLAYIALTRPSRGLLISYATADEAGGAMLPSPLLDDVLRALPRLTVQRTRPEDPPVCLPELAGEFLHAAATPHGGRLRRLCDWAGDDARLGERLQWLLRGRRYDNAPEKALPDTPAGEPPPCVVSPSEVETYIDCPFKHFAGYRLRLDPQRGPRPLSWDLGGVAHEILAAVTLRAMRERGGVRGLPDERWLELLAEAAEQYEQSQPADLRQRRPELVFQSRQLVHFLHEVLLAHADRWRRGRFTPTACEQAFGPSGEAGVWPAPAWQLDDGRRVFLRGKIDRVDCFNDGERTWLLIYDYKPRTATLAASFLTGARLQLFGYALAASEAPIAAGPTTVAGVFLAPVQPDVEALGKKYVKEADAAEERMYLYRPRGLFVRDVARSLDEQLGSIASPVAAMRLKKDGDFDRAQSRDVVAADDIAARLDLARRTMLQAASGLAAGDVRVEPLVEQRKLACTRCEFRPVCRFDRAFNRPRAAEQALPTLGSSESAEGDAT
ncbi:MAG: exodeoxyribonuclease V subunit gamma [Phycisphaerae bacterium]|jgi:ATP-dependent helicase/nuclease subunit B